MTMQDGTELEPKDEHEVICKTHGIKTTWGSLDAFQRLALESGLDTTPELPCLLVKNEAT